MTLVESLRNGTPDVRLGKTAAAENIPADTLKDGVIGGTVVIPWAAGHDLAKPIAVGTGCRVKVNANIGTSPDTSGLDEELAKLSAAVSAGADAVMDLSIGGDIRSIRRKIREACPVSLGSVPMYEAAFMAAS
ncbi:MAG: phosphomethylpyrimidine synthase ThiC, partial [Planctomycetes bacterium]|nr:phosphomethylpyrimidine synthase ThiC [Planctomycetota bacterium]